MLSIVTDGLWCNRQATVIEVVREVTEIKGTIVVSVPLVGDIQSAPELAGSVSTAPELAGALVSAVPLAGTLTTSPAIRGIFGVCMGAAVDLEVAQGEDRTLKLSVTDDAGDPFDLTGSTIFFTVRTSPKGAALISKSSAVASEILITDASGGLADIFLTDEDTGGLAVRDHVYDVFVQQADNSRNQVIDVSKLKIKARVTKL